MITNYIEPLWFFIGLIIGIIFTYFTVPEADYIIKYPTPDNAGKIMYKDSNGVCYKYKATEIECPSDNSKIVDMNLQHI